jgi:hypothetical protein
MCNIEANFGGSKEVSSVEEAVEFIIDTCEDTRIDKEMREASCGSHAFEFKGGRDALAFATKVHQKLQEMWDGVDLYTTKETTFPTISIPNENAYWDFKEMSSSEVAKWLEDSGYFEDKLYDFELLAEAFGDFPPFLQGSHDGEFLDHQRFNECIEKYGLLTTEIVVFRG